MKNVLLKFTGFFVERVPDEELEAHQKKTGVIPDHPSTPPPRHPSMPQHFPAEVAGARSGSTAVPQPHVPPAAQPIAVALKAWVPQDHAAHLENHGLKIVAASGNLSSDDARNWGAHAIVISSECLGPDTSMLLAPALPTVFVSPDPVTLPNTPGVVSATDPVHASEIASLVRAAVASFAKLP